MRHAPLLLAAILPLLTSCTKSSGPAGQQEPPPSAGGPPAQITIGVSLLTMANPFFKEIAEAMEEEGKKHGYRFLITAGEMDAARQKDQVKDFIVKRVSAIVLAPCDSRAIGASIAEANAAGIPVFTADIACLDKNAKVVSHIATDNYAGGKLAAQAMIEAIGERGKVAIIDHPEVESVLLRTKGFREVMARHKGIEIVAQLPGGAARDSAYKTAQDILEKHADLDGIFCINDPTAFGAIAALEKAGRLDRVKIVSFDGQLEALQAIKEGKIYADAIQYPRKIGQMTVLAIAKYLAGEKVPPETLIPTGLYRKQDAEADPRLN